MGGVTMTVPADTLNKMQSLTSENMAIVVSLVNQLSLDSPEDIFDALCEDGSKNPMSEEEVAAFVSNVRKERHALSN